MIVGFTLFLLTGTKSNANYGTSEEDCNCYGKKDGWVDGSCYLRAIEEQCNNNLWRPVKRCTFLENTPPSMCDCEDEELCPDEQ